jgi:hypothetical protein
VTSAQIARLEAEKALLQLQIDAAQKDDSATSHRSPRDAKSNGGKRP